MNQNPTLVILAAGMGSRYGGMKQIDGVGSHGEPIIELSIYDAYQAGFRKVVLIIRKETEWLFVSKFLMFSIPILYYDWHSITR